jgi:hypothetical protein
VNRSLAFFALLTLAALACNLPIGGATSTPTSPPEVPTATTEATVAPPTETTSAPTPTQQDTASPEPEVNLLAYITGGQLLVTNVAGGVQGGTTQYTQAGVDDQVFGAAWSPSGEYVAYTSRAAADPWQRCGLVARQCQPGLPA